MCLSFSGNGFVSVRYNEPTFNENKVIFADSTFFHVFLFLFVEDNPQAILSGPNSVVIDQTTARKYFGGQKAVGKTISMDERYNLQVTGVIADASSYSHIKFNCVVSYSTRPL